MSVCVYGRYTQIFLLVCITRCRMKYPVSKYVTVIKYLVAIFYNASHVYFYTDYTKLNSVGLLSPIYPSKERTPPLICWTPPPVYYTVAYIVGYHINLTDSAKGRMVHHMFIDNTTMCWKLTSFRNTTTLFSIAPEYVASLGLGQTRQILVQTSASECMILNVVKFVYT